MSYGQLTIETARYGYRNLVGLLATSVLVALALVPLVATVAVGTPLAVFGGLWTSALLVGLAAIGTMHFATTVAERGVAVPVRPSASAIIRNPWTGLGLGAVTFAVVVTALLIVAAVPGSLRSAAIGVASFLVTFWFVLVAFGAPELGDGRSLSTALIASIGRIGRGPGAVTWFLVVSFACTLVAGITVVTLVLFLPGVLALLAARAASVVDQDS